MSTTSLLYHGFGIAGYHLVSSEFENGVIKFRIEDNRIFRCTRCLSRDVIKRGTITRCLRTTPIGRKPIFIELPIQRIECCTCGTVRQVDVGFADERRSYTKAFERYVLDLSRFSTIYDVARHLGVSWDTVKDIQMRNLERRYRRINLKDLKLIAIDEISIGKGHQYLTIVLDLNTGAIVFTNEGKGAEALDPFWKKLKHSTAKIDAVAMDMSPAYAFAVKKNLPDAKTIDTASTSEASQIASSEEKSAAIASLNAAGIYGLDILAKNINDYHDNITRFWIISKKMAIPGTGAKTSIIMALDNTPGALYHALGVFSSQGINLTKIQSRPSRKGPWEYLFFIDFIGGLLEEKVTKSLENLKPYTKEIIILGSYPEEQGAD